MTKRPSLAGSVKPSKLAESMKPLAQETAPNPAELFEKVQAGTSPKETKPVVKRYEGMKKMLIPLDPDIHRKLKMLAVQNDLTLEKVVQDAISKYLASNSNIG